MEIKVTRQAVMYIMKKKEEVLKRSKTMQEQQVLSKNSKLHGVEKSSLEKYMLLWCRERRDRNEPISGPLIKKKAKIFNEKLAGPSNFKVSEGWLSRFK